MDTLPIRSFFVTHTRIRIFHTCIGADRQTVTLSSNDFNRIELQEYHITSNTCLQIPGCECNKNVYGRRIEGLDIQVLNR